MTQHLLRISLPENANKPLYWHNLQGDTTPLAIALTGQQSQKPLLVITPDNLSAAHLEDDLNFFYRKSQNAPRIVRFPDLETLAYDQFSPHQDIISQRLRALHDLPILAKGIIIVSITTLMQRLPPRDYIEKNTLLFNKGDVIQFSQFRERLQHNGYRFVTQVMEHGEFSIRGSIIDLYPMGCELPLRIDLFDNEIESISTFDPDTQRSIEKVNSINLLPGHEFPLTNEAITHFRQTWRSKFSGNPTRCPIYEDISQGIASSGIEYYLPLFFDHTALLFDYLPDDTCIVRIGDCHAAAETFWQEASHRYEQRSYDITRPILKPEDLFLRGNELFSTINQFRQIILSDSPTSTHSYSTNMESFPPPQLLIDHRAKQPLLHVIDFLNSHPQRILFCAESAGRREVLMEMLSEQHVATETFDSWQEFLNSESRIGMIEGSLRQGLFLENPPLIVITENQLFGEHVTQRRQIKRQRFDSATIVKNLTELRIGDPVVHIDHGIGRYRGLETITSGEITAEYLTLEYADEARIYVPVTSLDVITRYSGVDAESAPLDKLGSNKWAREKQKAAEKICDVAAELLDIYAKREAATGFSFSNPEMDYHRFSAAFPFDETPDQERAIEDVIRDMTSKKIMDRLICGDVGFGKTEVAMRAAFIAVKNNKQVAVLVPTTLLANQHYNSFSDRFADFNVSIEWLSRMRTPKENQAAIDDLASGKINIVIGTHKLLQESIQFNNLGLLIIDEEHRFGVRQKEIIKERRCEVDILSLTATPIPRTLNMAMSHLRDISLISTPPARRLSIKTFTQVRNLPLIREAILREIMRGGQVFFLHNKVETIRAVTDELTRLVPEATIHFAHGQMRERDLEHVMIEFYHHRFNVLVCTTIVENGIDIPTANTIIIDRADHFGLAQLHQLRGRVGRSHHQAYAYLMTPEKKLMSNDAIKRLDAIAAMEDLGAGFILASHDLEIRGAGELLGEEQSGSMHSIGFNLYMELLERAVKSLKSGKQPDLSFSSSQGISINLAIPAIIPENYLPDVQMRLTFYKRIANAENKEALRELQVEMIERFGLLPQEIKYLFRATELKFLAQKIKIEKIDADAKGGRLVFNEKPAIDPSVIIKLIQTQPTKYKLAGPNQLRFMIPSDSYEKRIDVVSGVLKELSG